MESKTVERLLQALETMMVRNYKLTVKMLAMERMLASRPTLEKEYNDEVRTMNSDLGNQTNIQSISEAIRDLRTMLLQE